MKREILYLSLFLLVMVTVSLSERVTGEYKGNITVYVKDQNGDNVNCYGTNLHSTPLECKTHLVDDKITVELYKDGERVAYTTGDLVDFLEPPKGYLVKDIVDVIPHTEKGRTYLTEKEYYWCLVENL